MHAKEATTSPGGKALNQATAARRLGATDVRLVGCVGDDVFGAEMLSALRHEGVNVDSVRQLESCRTSIAGIVVKDGLPGFIGAPNASRMVSEDQIRAALADLRQGDILLLDFEIPQPQVQFALQLGREAGAINVLNPAPFFTRDAFVLDYLHLVDVIIPNKLEAQLILDSDTDDADELATGLLQHGIGTVVLTLGEAGSLLVQAVCRAEQPAFKLGERCLRRRVLSRANLGLACEEDLGFRFGRGRFVLYASRRHVVLADAGRSASAGGDAVKAYPNGGNCVTPIAETGFEIYRMKNPFSRRISLSELDDSELVALAKEDKVAFGELYERYLQKIYSYVYYRTGNVHDAEDLTAKVFIRALSHISNYVEKGVPFQAWLYRIAHNLVANWHRDQGRRKIIALDDYVVHSLRSEAPDRISEEREEQSQLLEAFRRLPDDRQQLVLLKFVERMSA